MNHELASHGGSWTRFTSRPCSPEKDLSCVSHVICRFLPHAIKCDANRSATEALVSTHPILRNLDPDSHLMSSKACGQAGTSCRVSSSLGAGGSCTQLDGSQGGGGEPRKGNRGPSGGRRSHQGCESVASSYLPAAHLAPCCPCGPSSPPSIGRPCMSLSQCSAPPLAAPLLQLPLLTSALSLNITCWPCPPGPQPWGPPLKGCGMPDHDVAQGSAVHFSVVLIPTTDSPVRTVLNPGTQ